MICVRLILCIFLLIQGCSPNLDISTPDGFLRVFAKELTRGNSDLLYQHLSKQGKTDLKRCKVLMMKIRKQLAKSPELFKGYKEQQEQLSLGVLTKLAQDATEAMILLKLIQKKWDWLKSQAEEEILEGLNTRTVLSESDDGTRVTLLMRSSERISLVLENNVWHVSNFDLAIAEHAKVLEKNLKTAEQNLKEIKYRKKYNLALPKK